VSHAKFIESVTADELGIIRESNLEKALTRAVGSPNGLRAFASSFYFIRVYFVRINFIIGARCPTHELYWGGLAHNLMEELGGESGRAHNELYRWFMQEAGIDDENSLRCPRFAKDFNRAWEDYSREAPLEETLGAIAVYEILDNPDYQMLLRIMSRAGVSARGLVFFKVHAKATHFDLFEDYFRYVSQKPDGMSSLKTATHFVLETQRRMWSGLLAHLASGS
jgi:pyrroloquinoline quinone (PQQ) biosynthesis protein C